MSHSSFDSSEATHFIHEISSKCQWSEIYQSLEEILRRTAEPLPFLVSYPDSQTDDYSSSDYQRKRTILFFDRYKSTKLILRPLQQRPDQRFEHFPRSCTFSVSDLFKGLFEFVVHGQRLARIFSQLAQLIDFASTLNSATIFMSRNAIVGYHQNPLNFHWIRRHYAAGAIFQAQRIHRFRKDYVECLDEDGLTIFFKLNQNGRFSFIASSIEQQENHPEQFLHSTNTPKIEEILQRLGSKTDVCIRLVRGSVPSNFFCQHFQIVRRVKFDTLVGLTSDGFLVEGNIRSQAPCRYATNFNEISAKKPMSRNLLEQAKHFYREDFQQNFQLFSRFDWIELFSYWKWTGEWNGKFDDEHLNSYRNPRQSDFLVSIRDLHDRSRTLISSKEENRRRFFTQMSKLLASSTRYPSQRLSKFALNNDVTPFDNSIYESNSRKHFR